MTSESSPRVTVSLTAEDLFRFEWYHIRHTGLRFAIWIWYLGFIVVGFSSAMAGSDDSLPTGIAFALLAAVIAPLVGRWLLRMKTAHDFRKMPAPLREATFEISPTGFRQSGSFGEGTFKWSALRKVVGTPDHILFYLTGRLASVIPRRDFASAAEADAFLEAARKWHADATSHL